jgi:hypothetical protein
VTARAAGGTPNGASSAATRLASLALVTVVLLIAGCGSNGGDSASNTATTVKREAAGAGCPEQSSLKTVFPVANYLNEPIRLRAYDIDCADWSGSSTPDRVFDNVVLQPGEKRDFRLEPYPEGFPKWSLEIASTKKGGSNTIGRIRIWTEPGMRGGSTVPPYEKISGLAFMKLKPTDKDPVPIDKLDVKNGFAFTYYDGYIQAVSKIPPLDPS